MRPSAFDQYVTPLGSPPPWPRAGWTLFHIRIVMSNGFALTAQVRAEDIVEAMWLASCASYRTPNFFYLPHMIIDKYWLEFPKQPRWDLAWTI